jgi:hypothetical protein
VGDANRAYAAVVGWAAAAITATLLNCGSVAAADTINAGSWRPTLSLEPATSEPDPAPVSQTVGGRFQVTAREWFSGVSKVEAYNHAVASNVMMLHGGSIAYAWDNGYAVALSAYYGLGYGNFFDTFSEGITYLERLDVEAVLKVPLGTLPAYGAFGVRYVEFKRDDTATAHGSYLDHARRVDYKHYLAEIGVGGVVGLDESGTKHRMFGGVMFVGGMSQTNQSYSTYDSGPFQFPDPYSPPASKGIFGIDTHFGYAYNPSQSVTFSIRYRAFVMADIMHYSLGFSNQGISQSFQYSSYSLVHGPEINLAYQF